MLVTIMLCAVRMYNIWLAVIVTREWARGMQTDMANDHTSACTVRVVQV